MTFKELLDSVNFDNVAPHIVRMYPDMKDFWDGRPTLSSLEIKDKKKD